MTLNALARRTALMAAAVLLPLAATAQPLDVGGALPEAARPLRTADGATLSLAQAAGPGGLVVVFWSSTCPWATRVSARLADLAAEYARAGVGFVAINSSDSTRLPDENVVGMRRAAAEAGFTFPFALDEGGALAGAFGAENAPEFFFFGADRRLAYRGAFDDSPADAATVEVPYLRQAIDQHLAGDDVSVKRTRALGCSIRT